MPVAVPKIQDTDDVNATAAIINWIPVPDNRENMKGRVRGYTVSVSFLHIIIQSAVVISTSVISNNPLSRRKVWSLFSHTNLKSGYKILWKRGEIAPREQFFHFSTIFQYIFLIKGVKLHSHL